MPPSVDGILQGARSSTTRVRDAVLDGADAVGRSLARLDDKVLQRTLWSQFLSEYAKALHQAGIQQYADAILAECTEGPYRSVRCVGGLMRHLGLGGLNAANPFFYVREVALTVVTVLWKNEQLTELEANQWRAEIEMAFVMMDLIALTRLLGRLETASRAVGKVRLTAAGSHDRRFKATQELIKLNREALEDATLAIDDSIKKSQQDAAQKK